MGNQETVALGKACEMVELVDDRVDLVGVIEHAKS